MTVKVKKLGGSVAGLIPKTVARQMGLTEGAALDVSITADAIVLRKHARRPRRPLAQVVEAINPASYRRRGRELAPERPVGKELW